MFMRVWRLSRVVISPERCTGRVDEIGMLIPNEIWAKKIEIPAGN
jgi:hypothetical protein